MQKIMTGEATVSVAKPRTKVTARRLTAELPPRKVKKLKHSHRTSLLAGGQPFGKYNGNRVSDTDEELAIDHTTLKMNEISTSSSSA